MLKKTFVTKNSHKIIREFFLLKFFKLINNKMLFITELISFQEQLIY